jgi:saccharopine dehydrogenase-like NADP-dependent oxidoreductase
MTTTHKIVIAGAGGIGRAVGLILAEWSDLPLEIAIGDVDSERADGAAAWIREDQGGRAAVHSFPMPAEGSDETLERVLAGADVLLDCLPWSQAVRMAELARRHDLHYANLTEHMPSSDRIAEIAEGSSRAFVLQTGLAPGFIDVLGHKLFQDFCRRHEVDRVESLRLREALTSGGAADLPAALAGRVDSLDYKTLRYPGHWSWVHDRIAELQGVDPIAELEAVLLKAIPQVERDQVVIYAAVEGLDHAGERHRVDESLIVRPCQVGRHTLRAIQSTTAAGLAESARMLLVDGLEGVVQQSRIDPEVYLNGPFIRKVYYGEV